MLFLRMKTHEDVVTSAEADKYLEDKRKREAEENSQRAKESVQVGPSNQGGPNVFMASESVCKDSNPRPAGQYINDLDALSFYETQLLSEAVSMQFLISNYLSL